MHLFLHNCHHTIADDSGVDLCPDSAFGVSPEFFYSQMLLEPLEKQLNLPSLMIWFCNNHWVDINCVSEDYELPFVFFVPISDAADLFRVLLSGELFDIFVTFILSRKIVVKSLRSRKSKSCENTNFPLYMCHSTLVWQR